MAYLCIDVGGTKTLVARVSDQGVIETEEKFPTPSDYNDFIASLAKYVDSFTTDDIRALSIGMPGRIDHDNGVAIAFGNLPWRDVPIRADLQRLTNLPIFIDNDADLAGLSEAMLRKDVSKVLYVTISTGIGTGFIVNRTLDGSTINCEGGHILLSHDNKLAEWEHFASGKAIVERYGKRAEDIHDAATWDKICDDWAPGFVNLCALLSPDVIVIGGSVGTYFDRYGDILDSKIRALASPVIIVPPLEAAGRPEKAVVYGCYDLAASHYAATN